MNGDMINLQNEINNKILIQYLHDDEFTQNLKINKIRLIKSLRKILKTKIKKLKIE